jgi:hypothetical protein
VSRDIRMKQAYLRDNNRLWGPHLQPVPREDWLPVFDGMKAFPFCVFRSCRFVAQVFDEVDGARRISVQRTMIDDNGNWLQGITWDDLMLVKDDCGYGNCWAVEIFPPNTEVVNVANMRHLWLLPEAPPFAWRRV